jgi:hypothetical protein
MTTFPLSEISFSQELPLTQDFSKVTSFTTTTTTVRKSKLNGKSHTSTKTKKTTQKSSEETWGEKEETWGEKILRYSREMEFIDDSSDESSLHLQE